MTKTMAENYECKIYPGGNRAPRVERIENIYAEDANYFVSIGAKTSMEPTAGQYALYADLGLFQSDGETPREVIQLSGSMNCQDAFSELRKKCEKELSK